MSAVAPRHTSQPTVSLKQLFRLHGGATPEDRPEFWNGDIPWVTPEDLGRLENRAVAATRRTITAAGYQSCGTSLAPAGSLVLSTRAPIGHVAITATAMCANQGCKILEPRVPLSPEYYHYVMLALKPHLQSLGSGSTFVELSRTSLGSVGVPFLSFRDQRAVADYLDRETAAIDRLVDEKRRLVDLLKERHEATVVQWATMGLDVSAPIRDPKLAWLPAVPHHWEVAPLGTRYSVQLGKMLDEKAIRGAHTAAYLRNVNVQWDRIDLSDLKEMDFDPEDRCRFALQPGDVLICEGGEVGRSAVWEAPIPECYYQKALHRVRPRTARDNPRYLLWVLYAAARSGIFTADGNRNTIVHLTAVKLRAHRFPFPPREEQDAIVAAIDAYVRLSESTHSSISSQVALLKERRAALVTAAVTGQLGIPAA